MFGQCPWVFYTHLAVARVQQFVPPPVRRPYAIFLHGIEAWRNLPAGMRRVLDGAALRVANSQFTARRVAEAHPGVGPIVVCPLALPPESHRVTEATSIDLAGIGQHAVILVARMLTAEHYKGHDEVLESWPAVVARVPDAQLVFVGTGDDSDRLRAKAASLGIAGSVVLTGFVSTERLRALYQHAAMCAMPSRGEGFGLVYLEAMSYGLPCIGSMHDAAGEIIDDGVSGLLVDQTDTSSLADAIVHLLQDDGLRRAMGEAGRRRLEREFSYEQFSRRLLSHIEQTLGDPVRDVAPLAGASR
jgi:phosphatidylinositol alpha-1,6-mannosyltransferase